MPLWPLLMIAAHVGCLVIEAQGIKEGENN